MDWATGSSYYGKKDDIHSHLFSLPNPVKIWSSSVAFMATLVTLPLNLCWPILAGAASWILKDWTWPIRIMDQWLVTPKVINLILNRKILPLLHSSVITCFILDRCDISYGCSSLWLCFVQLLFWRPTSKLPNFVDNFEFPIHFPLSDPNYSKIYLSWDADKVHISGRWNLQLYPHDSSKDFHYQSSWGEKSRSEKLPIPRWAKVGLLSRVLSDQLLH